MVTKFLADKHFTRYIHLKGHRQRIALFKVRLKNSACGNQSLSLLFQGLLP